MSFFTKVFAAFGAQPGVRAWTVDNKLSAADNRPDMEARKARSNQRLAQHGIPPLEEILPFRGYQQGRFRKPDEVARRALVLRGLVLAGSGEKTTAEVMAYFTAQDLEKQVSEIERQLLKQPTCWQPANSPLLWRREALHVLLWSLGLVDTLRFPTQVCPALIGMPAFGPSPAEWIATAQLRDPNRILDEADLAYRLHDTVRYANMHNKSIPGRLNPHVVMERHFALKWLVMAARNWDDITVDS